MNYIYFHENKLQFLQFRIYLGTAGNTDAAKMKMVIVDL